MIDCINTLGLIPASWGCDLKRFFKVMRGKKLKHPLGSLSDGAVGLGSGVT